MNFKIALAATAALVSPVAYAQDAQRILEGARVAASLTQLDDGLSGNISPKSGKRVPLTLFLRGKDIQFAYNERGGDNWDRFHLRLSDNSYELFEMIGGGQRKFPDAKITSPIAGSDLTYEDLSFRFFYWPNPTLEGVENVGTQSCYKIRVNKPSSTVGRYDTVYIWVHTKFGAFMQVKGYNNGKLLKEFKVEDVMKISDDVWTLRKMQVASYDANERRQSITQVTFDAPKKAPKSLKR